MPEGARSGGESAEPLALDFVRLQFAAQSNELQAQRNQKDALRNRSIALFSAGSVVFGLTQTQASSAHLDGWLLASLVALVTMGLCVAYILLPTPAFGMPDLDPDAFQELDQLQYWRRHIDRFRQGVRENKRWENRAWLLHSAVACLLVTEASLIAAHFSSPDFRAAIVVLTSVGLIAFVFGPLGTALEVVQESNLNAFPSAFWASLRRLRVIGDPPNGHPSLQDAPLPSSAVSPPTPGFALEARSAGSRQLEEALAKGEDAASAIRRAHVLALGQVAGDISHDGTSGSETDLLHEEEDGGEPAWVPVFTDMTHLGAPLREHPDWQSLSILDMDGAALVDAIDDDVEIRINPGAEPEGRIPPRGGGGGA